jgi:uncharacterized protein (TIGR02217 family)
MPITVLNDVILPETVIAAGISGKNMRSNIRSISASGYGSININWSRTLRQYELGIKPMSVAQWAEIEGLHEITEGGALGFLMQDPKDAKATEAQGFLQPYLAGAEVGTIGFGYGVPEYKLRKKYTSIGGTRISYRNITRPNGITVKRGGSTVTEGTSASQIEIDQDDGTVTFVADSSQAITLITVGSTTVLEFANNTGMVAAMAVGGRVYISGVTGTAATALNGKSHAVTAKDTGANTITISVVTTGLTAESGTAFKYPQPTEALVWSGDFYVPVHFANDEIDWELLLGGMDDGRIVAGQSVVLQEIRE